jgi:DNA-binding transcriptional LysR family regulator
MDFNKLKTFLVVADEMSVTRAAQRLLRTQSAVTQQLQRLEADLGVALLQRKRGRIFLTAEGESVRRIAAESYARLETHLADLLSRTQSVDGVIRVGIIADFGGELVLRAIAAFKERYPRVDFHVAYGNASEAIERLLLANEIDLGLIVTFRDKALFHAKPVLEQHHLLVASRGYLAAHGSIATWRDLGEARVIDFTDDLRSFRAWLKRNGRAALPEWSRRRANLVIQSQVDAKAAVLMGLGIAVLPLRLIGGELRTGRLVRLIAGSRPVTSGVDLAWRRKETPKLIHAAFRDTLLRIARGPRLAGA